MSNEFPPIDAHDVRAFRRWPRYQRADQARNLLSVGRARRKGERATAAFVASRRLLRSPQTQR